MRCKVFSDRIASFATFFDHGENRMDNRFRNFRATIKRKEREGEGSVPRLFTARSKKGHTKSNVRWLADKPCRTISDGNGRSS